MVFYNSFELPAVIFRVFLFSQYSYTTVAYKHPTINGEGISPKLNDTL